VRTNFVFLPRALVHKATHFSDQMTSYLVANGPAIPPLAGLTLNPESQVQLI